MSLCCKSAWNADWLAIGKCNRQYCFFFTQGFKEKNKFIAAQGKCRFVFGGSSVKDPGGFIGSGVFNSVKSPETEPRPLHIVHLAWNKRLVSLLIHLLINFSTKTCQSVFPKAPRWRPQTSCFVHNLKTFTTSVYTGGKKPEDSYLRSSNQRFFFILWELSWLYLDRTERESGWNAARGPWAKSTPGLLRSGHSLCTSSQKRASGESFDLLLIRKSCQTN